MHRTILKGFLVVVVVVCMRKRTKTAIINNESLTDKERRKTPIITYPTKQTLGVVTGVFIS